MLSHSRLLELLSYEPESGSMTWRLARRGTAAGTPAGGSWGSKGYIGVCIDGRHYFAHRLAWFYVSGDWPPQQIDHINGNRSDNRIENLRLADQSHNNANSPKRQRNRSGFKGVSLHKGRWRAAITKGRKSTHLGYFDTAELAHEAYAAASREKFGTYGRS